MRYLPAALLLLSAVSACTAQPPADSAPPGSGSEPVVIEQPAETPATTPAESQKDDSAEAWLDRIERRATDIKTLTANLRYDQNQLLLGDEQRRFGELTYEAGPPPRFNVHFNKKLVDGHWSQPDLYYIYDGHWLLKRDHESKTAVRYQLVADDEEAGGQMELGEGPFPLPLNLKKDKVLARFDAKVIPQSDEDPEPIKARDSFHLRLTPLEGNKTDLLVIDLWFDRESVLPLAVSSLDESETQTAVFLLETQVNPELDNQTFDTALPVGQGWQTDENRIVDAPKTTKPTD